MAGATLDYADGTLKGEDYTATSIVYSRKYYSTAKNDGWVLELSECSNKGGSFDAISEYFQLGDDALNRQYKAILSFNFKLPAGTIFGMGGFRSSREH